MDIFHFDPYDSLFSNLLTFWQAIFGVTVAMANTTSFISAYKLGIIQSLNSDDVVVTIKSITSSQKRRQLLASGVTIVSAISAANVAVITLTSRLNLAISTGSFTNLLSSSGYPGASATAVAVVFDYTPSSSPTIYPSSSAILYKSYSLITVGEIVGVSVGVAAGVLFLCFGIYYVRKHFRKKADLAESATAAVDDSLCYDDMADMNIIVMERKVQGSRLREFNPEGNI